MTHTPEDHAARIRAYYETTTESSYLTSWSPDSLAMHLGVAGDGCATHEQCLANTNRLMADRLGVGPDTVALDAGCGVGGTSIWMARERGATVTGVTIAPNQVELARTLAAAKGVGDRVTFHHMDYAATTLPEASFDVVWNIESLCHAPDPVGYFQHVFTLLKPGGRYGCLEYFRTERTRPEHLKTLADGWMIPSLMSVDEARAHLNTASFTEVDVTLETAGVQASAARLHAMASERLKIHRVEQFMRGQTDPVYLGHTLGALAVAEGLLGGTIVYALIRAQRPR